MSLPKGVLCAGCGCSEDHACSGSCCWIWVDVSARVGLCSKCISWPPSSGHPSPEVRALARQWRRLIRQAHEVCLQIEKRLPAIDKLIAKVEARQKGRVAR